MNSLPLAFLLGLMGSLHCAVMCGPLMLSLPLPKQDHAGSIFSRWAPLGQLILYQLGRIFTYTILGILVGTVGNSITVYLSQEAFSFGLGLLLVLFTVLHFVGRRLTVFQNFQLKLITPISSLMGKLYGMPFWGLFAGMLNGLIPCGMVYLALATALSSNSIQNSAMFMALFGLGTTPLMLGVSLGGIYLKKYIRFNSVQLIPWFTLFLGALFIMRSASIGIPFLSPSLNDHFSTKVIECK